MSVNSYLLATQLYSLPLRISNRVTTIVFLGGCIENTLLSREGIFNYSKLPSICTVHGELVGGLTLMASHTVSLLQRHPGHLSALLQQYIKQQQPELEAVPKTEETKAGTA